ncbi:MAG: hypothetical protein Q3962_05130 [Corynebacterium sp.]|nr:hypothetical protein [Corynebacterium sp.]
MMIRGRALIASLMIGSAALTGVVAAPAAHADAIYAPVVNSATRSYADFNDEAQKTLDAFNKLYDSLSDANMKSKRPSMDNIITGIMGTNVGAAGGTITFYPTVSDGARKGGVVDVYSELSAEVLKTINNANGNLESTINSASSVLGFQKAALQSMPMITYYLFQPFTSGEKPNATQAPLVMDVYNAAMALRAKAINFEVADSVHFDRGTWTINEAQAKEAGFDLNADKTQVSYDPAKQGGVIGAVGKVNGFFDGLKNFVTSSALSS